MTEFTFSPAHLHLLDLGFQHEYVEPDWEDVGGPENGPMIQGHPGFHVYTTEDMEVYFDVDGSNASYQEMDKNGWPIKASY